MWTRTRAQLAGHRSAGLPRAPGPVLRVAARTAVGCAPSRPAGGRGVCPRWSVGSRPRSPGPTRAHGHQRGGSRHERRFPAPGPMDHAWQWQRLGACRGMDSAVFFHPDGERNPSRARRTARAKEVCHRCPVMDLCREFALETREPFGVWGASPRPSGGSSWSGGGCRPSAENAEQPVARTLSNDQGWARGVGGGAPTRKRHEGPVLSGTGPSLVRVSPRARRNRRREAR